MKNYVVRFMDKSTLSLTAAEAAGVAKEWQKGGGLVLIKGNMYAVHQICSITRVSQETEKDLCDMAGIPYKEAPTIEKLLAPNQKRLNG